MIRWELSTRGVLYCLQGPTGAIGPKGSQVKAIRAASNIQRYLKHTTYHVTAQGDQGETGDIGVKGDQVRVSASPYLQISASTELRN